MVRSPFLLVLWRLTLAAMVMLGAAVATFVLSGPASRAEPPSAAPTSEIAAPAVSIAHHIAANRAHLRSAI